MAEERLTYVDGVAWRYRAPGSAGEDGDGVVSPLRRIVVVAAAVGWVAVVLVLWPFAPTGHTWVSGAKGTHPGSGIAAPRSVPPPGLEGVVWYDGEGDLAWVASADGRVYDSAVAAREYCESLTLAGQEDWRLPSPDELRSLIVACRLTQTGGACPLTSEAPGEWGSACRGCGAEVECHWPRGLEGPCGWYWAWSPKEDGSGDYGTAVNFDTAEVKRTAHANGYNRLRARCVRRGEWGPGAGEADNTAPAALAPAPAGQAGLDWFFSVQSGVYMSRSEITVGQYGRCVEGGVCADGESGGGACARSTLDDHPVTCVNLEQAAAFCLWAGGKLPTFDEWYAEASRGGSRKFPWGDDDPSCATVAMNGGATGCGPRGTRPVCSAGGDLTPAGACDMAGNVREWTTTPHSHLHTAYLVVGGSVESEKGVSLMVINKGKESPAATLADLGFRCVADPGGRAEPPLEVVEE